MVIYVTGKSGSGKSTFSKELAKQLNYKYIDVDEIGHRVYDDPEIMEKVYQLFGNSINNEDGKFDRKRLGKIVFGEKNSERVKAFGSISWNYMKKLIDKEITDNSIVDWIILPNTEFWNRKALKILVKSNNDEQRFQKIMQRDNVSEEYVKLRDQSSIKYNEDEFDFVLNNDYSDEQLEENISTVINYINSLSKDYIHRGI